MMQRQCVRSASDPTVNLRNDERIELQTLHTPVSAPETQNHSSTSLPVNVVSAPVTAAPVPSVESPPPLQPDAQDHGNNTGDAISRRGSDMSAQDNQPPESPTELAQFNTYIEYLSNLLPVFPDIRILRLTGQNDAARISVLDSGVDGFFNARTVRALKRPLSQHFQKLVGSRIPDRVALRVVLIEDIDTDVLVELGAYFDLDPEFFQMHLELSDHVRQGSACYDPRARRAYRNNHNRNSKFFLKHLEYNPQKQPDSGRFEPRLVPNNPENDEDKESRRKGPMRTRHYVSPIMEDIMSDFSSDEDKESRRKGPMRRRHYVSPIREDSMSDFSIDVSRDLGVKAMFKSFRSICWYRPVEMSPLKVYSRKEPQGSRSKFFGLKDREVRLDETTPDLNSTESTGVCRLKHWEFGADESMGALVDRRRRLPLAFWRERLTVCEIDIGHCRVAVILCDPIPRQGESWLFEPLSSRGSWSSNLDQRFREFSLGRFRRRKSSRQYIQFWLNEQASTGVSDCAESKSVLRLLFTLAERDTKACLLQIRLRASEVESAMYIDSVVQENVAQWRKWLSESQGIMTEIEQQLSGFVEVYDSNVQGTISPTKRWTSANPAHQHPHTESVRLFFQGPTTKKELKLTRQLLRGVKEDMKNTRSIIEQINDSLRTTVSLIESRRAISEAESVTKLTELAFFFIPLSFAASFFSMPLDILNGSVQLQTWVIFSVVLISSAYILRLSIRSGPFRAVQGGMMGHARQFGMLRKDQPVPTYTFIAWLVNSVYSRFKSFLTLIMVNTLVPAWEIFPHAVSFVMIIALPVPILWSLYAGNLGLKVALTVFCALLWALVIVISKDGGFLNTSGSSAWLTGAATPAARSGEQEHPLKWKRFHETLSVFQLLLRLLLLSSTIIAPIVIIWTLLPAPLGARIGLTFVALLPSPYISFIIKRTLIQHKAGKWLINRFPSEQLIQALDSGVRWFSRVTRLYLLARWLHRRPWKRGIRDSEIGSHDPEISDYDPQS